MLPALKWDVKVIKHICAFLRPVRTGTDGAGDALVGTQGPQVPKARKVTKKCRKKVDLNNFDTVADLPTVVTVGRFICKSRLDDDSVQRLEQIHTWFSDECLESIVAPMLDRNNMSRRSLDWLVTNYAKKAKIRIQKGESAEPVDIWKDYNAWQFFYRRRLFDPFRRKTRIWFELNGKYVATTVAQLNFFYWALTSGVMDYAIKHREKIVEDNKQCTHKSKKEIASCKAKGIKRKRHELSRAPTVKCHIYEVPVSVVDELS